MSTAVLAHPAPPPSQVANNLYRTASTASSSAKYNMASSSSQHQPSSSSSSNQLQSPSQQPTKVRRQRPDTEEIRRVGRIHYQELLNFLRSHLAKDQTGPRSNAREKLTRLSKQQFTELSTDVYDELMRRINNAKRNSAQPHLAVRDEFHPKRNQARQKLATLPKTRFKDLSSDVFFELERRFPELKEHFRPEAAERDRKLAAQQEEEQQQQQSKDSQQQQQQQPPPTAQESTSEVVIPAKSTLVQEDIAVPYKNNGSPHINGSPGSAMGRNHRASDEDDDEDETARSARDSYDNRSTMYSQASSLGTGFLNGYAGSRATIGSNASPNIDRGSHSEGFPNVFGIEKLKSDYEFRIATLQQRITSLEAQNTDLKEHSSRGNEEQQKRLQMAIQEREQLRKEYDDEIRSLQNQVDNHRQEHDAKHRQLQDTMDRLDEAKRDLEDVRISGRGGGGHSGEDFERLQAEYAEQEQVVHDLRSEVESLVEEVQQLSARNEELVSEKDQDLVVIRDLNQQIQTFKRKYEQAKTELRQYKATSQLYVQPPKADEFMPPSPTGVIADVNVTAFQSSIDELLSAARSTAPWNALIAMKAVVLATTLVTDDVAKFEQSSNNHLNSDDADSLLQLKPKISTSLNNLMTACRNHASSQGLSPVSLLDAAASHVSTTVVDLVKLLKVRSATSSEKEQFEAHFAGGNAPPNGLKPLHIGSVANSGKSPTFSPTLDASEWKVRSSGERLNPIDTSAAARLSPRATKPMTPSSHGRYSPVGYRPSVARKDSAGSWKAGNGHDSALSRAASGSSDFQGGHAHNGFGINGNSGHSGIPALPRTDLKSVKHQWSSPPRRRRTSGRSSGIGAGSTRGGNSEEDGVGTMSSSTSFENGSFGGSLNGHGNGTSGAVTLPRLSHSGSGNGNGLTGAAPGIVAEGTDSSSEENWAELQNYIEVQTEAIVHCIQALLSAIREGAQGVQLNENLVQITTIALSIVAISQDNLPVESKERGQEILNNLSENCEKLLEMQTHTSFDKGTKSIMASASYGVAKGLKELNVLLNSDAREADVEIDLS
ncbi:unnamed protein product [Sympodiomycopsis kandeliae]